MSIVRSGSSILMELIDLVNSCYYFSISSDLAQMVNFPTWIPDCDSHSPALLDLFISSGTSICSAMAFCPLGNSDHVVMDMLINMEYSIGLKKNAKNTFLTFLCNFQDKNKDKVLFSARKM